MGKRSWFYSSRKVAETYASEDLYINKLILDNSPIAKPRLLIPYLLIPQLLSYCMIYFFLINKGNQIYTV